MSVVTLLWSIIATFAMTLAVFCALAWILERRNLAYFMFCVTAVATAACAPFELGMMHATTAAEYGAWLRNYHLPIFFVLLGQLLFVHFYLGTGLRWLLGIFIVWRLAILIVNFSVEPNFHFHEITALRQISFLGEQVSVVGRAIPRSWQSLAFASMVLMTFCIGDAALRRWRKGDAESRRKALLVGLGIGGPMILNISFNQLVVMGVVHTPIFAMVWFIGTLVTVAYELGREFVLNSRARLQVAQLRGELAQLGRVGILGQLASGLAHELAQPLTAALGNAEAAQIHLRKDSPDVMELRAIVADIHQDTQRAADVIDRMRSLIRGQIVEKQSVNIDEVFRDVFRLLHSEAIARGVVLSSKVDDGAPCALGDRVQISQVLLNLLMNAMDALQSCAAGARRVLVEAQSAPGGELEVAVTDSGPGIPNDQIEEIFSPLFTTKPNSLGLGLALSRTIVDAHGGRMWAENGGVGKGAVLRMILPAA